MKNWVIILIVALAIGMVAMFVYNQRMKTQLATKVKDESEKTGGFTSGLNFLNNLFDVFKDKDENEDEGNEDTTGDPTP